MKITEFITAEGHPGITAKHPTTLMITRDAGVGPGGDCVIAVGASKGAADLGEGLKRAVRTGRIIRVRIEAGDLSETVEGIGHRALSLSDPTDIVIRKSSFTCNRTLVIRADKAAADLPRALVHRLRDPEIEVRITIESGGASPV